MQAFQNEQRKLIHHTYIYNCVENASLLFHTVYIAFLLQCFVFLRNKKIKSFFILFSLLGNYYVYHHLEKNYTYNSLLSFVHDINRQIHHDILFFNIAQLYIFLQHY